MNGNGVTAEGLAAHFGIEQGEAAREALRAASEAGLCEAELRELLELRAGCEGNRRLGELLGTKDDVVHAQIRLRGRLSRR